MTTELCEGTFPMIGIPHVGALLSTSSNNRKITAVRYRSQGLDAFRVPAEESFVAKMRIHNVRCDVAASTPLRIDDLRNGSLCRKDSPFHELYIHVPQAALDHIADEANASRVFDLRTSTGWSVADPILTHINTCLVETTESPHTVSQLFVDYTLMALVTHLARTYGGMRERARRLSGGLAAWQERRAREMIAANLTKDLSLDQIAVNAISPRRISRAHSSSPRGSPRTHGYNNAGYSTQNHCCLTRICTSRR